MSGIVAPSLRRIGLCIVAVLAAISIGWVNQRPVLADEPSLSFPIQAATESTGIVSPSKDEPRLPFCALYKMNREAIDPGNKDPLGATPCEAGTAAGYPCSNVDLQAFVPLASFGSVEGSSLWGWTDAASGREFALFGATDGTAFFEITNPTAPLYLGKLDSHTSDSIWRELKTYDDHVFIVSDFNGNHGIQVFDLTQLLDVENPPVLFTETGHYDGVGSVHNIAIDETAGFAYALGSDTCNGGLHMVDIRTPATPVYAGCFEDDGYTHDAQCLTYTGPDQDYVGEELCIGSNEDTVTIVNVTDKANPVQISRTGYAGAGYTHQSWLTPDGNYMVLDDEFDENGVEGSRTYMWDMRNLDAPSVIDVHNGTTPAIDHNQYTKDGYVFQANYTAGLRVLDAGDIANGNLTEIGYFDIYPASDEAFFAAAWNVFPYFDSGNVIVSGIEQGLFVLKPTNLTPPTAVEVSGFTTTPAAPDTTLPLAAAFGLLMLAGVGVAIRRRR
jgi:choice-of-anchor B domain-containing protein